MDPKQKPTLGRIVHVFLETGAVRPAIITRVGPAWVNEKDTGQVAYELFLTPEDGRIYQGGKAREGHERVASEAWAAGDWSWPART